MPKSERIDFRKNLEEIAHTRNSIVGVFSDFAKISACALALQTREEEYMETIKGYSRPDLDQFTQAFAGLTDEMEGRPFEDVLGMYYTEINSKSTQDSRGEFFTPPSISHLLAELSFEPEKVLEENKPITVNDPCCGSGGMMLQCAKLLAPRQDLLRVTMQDINPTACDMSYVNMTLWSIPAEIVLGNTLTMEWSKHWKNFHWARVGEDQRRRMFQILDAVNDLMAPISEDPEAEEKPPLASPSPTPASASPSKPIENTGKMIQPELF